LITEHPELRTHLQTAWESKKFEEIRQLRKCLRSNIPLLTRRKLSCRLQARTKEEAWKQPYQSHAHEVLYESICEMWAAAEGPYKNILAVIQSSGHGKTRMLDEHAKIVFTFPFVIRNPKETTDDSAYPHPDQSVHEFIITFGNTEDEIRAGYYIVTTNSSLSCLVKPTASQSSYQRGGGATWPNPINGRISTQKSSIVPNRPSQYAPTFPGLWLKLMWWRNLALEGDNLPKPQERRGGIKVEKAAEEFLQVIPTPKEAAKVVKAGKAVKAVIYFDEVHELAEYKVKEERNRLDVLYSCLDIFTSLPLMSILTSTTSSLHQLASTRDRLKSTRRATGKSVNQAPITELPFDCHPSLSTGLEPNGYSFQAICELKFLASFGRPLFWSLLKGGEKQESVLSLAKYKLAPLKSDKIYQGHDIGPDPTYSLTALIDLLLMLDYNPDHKTVQELQKKLVSSHMRTCISIPADREYIRSCYPSEPFLAEAAMTRLAEILYLDDNTYPDCVIDTINSHFSHGLLHSGDLGELATRMLLIDAYMTACRKAVSRKQAIYSRGCKLTDFLTHLFRKPEIVLEAKPDNVFNGPTFKDAFKDAVVRFTHFGRFVDDTATLQDAAHAAFFRSMAIICHDTQKSVDIIVPVLSTTDGAVCQHVITSILIQVKRRICASKPRLLAIDQSNLEFFPPKVTICNCAKKPRNTELPYISFLLDLGVRARPELTQVLEPPTRPSSRKQLPKHHRYAINTRGLTSYGSVTEWNLSKYERLLRLSNVLGDHPRQSSSHLNMVRRLKPFWAHGEAFDWIKNEALTVSVAPTEGDALEVGKYEGEDDT
ncbi:hypothetical protein JOM56_012237, partial [Amanita muscaria]